MKFKGGVGWSEVDGVSGTLHLLRVCCDAGDKLMFTISFSAHYDLYENQAINHHFTEVDAKGL